MPDKWNDPQKYLKLPQGAFSGPSKDDIVNALALFFGSPSNPEKLADYTQISCQCTQTHSPAAFTHRPPS